MGMCDYLIYLSQLPFVKNSSFTIRCNLQRDSVALCNLIPYSAKLPVEFRNLDAIPGVQKAVRI